MKTQIFVAACAISLGLSGCTGASEDPAAPEADGTPDAANAGDAGDVEEASPPVSTEETTKATEPEATTGMPEVPALASGKTRYLCDAGDVESWVDVGDSSARNGSFVASEMHTGPNPIVYVDFNTVPGAKPAGGSAKTYWEAKDGSRLEFGKSDTGEKMLIITEKGADMGIDCYPEGSSYWNN